MPGPWESRYGKSAHGCLSVTTTVLPSLTTVSLTRLVHTLDQPLPLAAIRSKLALTAAASYGVPSVNVRPSRRPTVHSVKSVLALTDAAIAGTYLPASVS